jgi:hypothetical protein
MKTILRALFRGKFTVLAVVAVLTLGTASAALAGSGVGGVFNLGVTNSVDAITNLVGSVTGPSLRIDNNSADSAATALDLQVEAGSAPMKVNSGIKVTNLNADLLDDKNSTQFATAINGKAVNADRLDGLDSTEFLSTLPYENRRLVLIGANRNEAVTVSCDTGDRALSGGADHIDPPTVLLETSRFGIEQAWEIEVRTGNSQDQVGAEVYCWDRPPFRP